MGPESELATLNSIAQALNKAVDVQSSMQYALEKLLDVMGLETGRIFIKDEANQDRWTGRGYSLVAYQNLPPALALEQKEPWEGGCDCQGFCNKGKLTEAYNEVRCTRLRDAQGDRRGLVVHASAPLKSGDNVLGILNVAAPDWDAFSHEALDLLTNIGMQMGVALERARLYDLLQERRINEQQVLLEISRQLLQKLDLEDLSRYLRDDLPGTLNIEASALWVARGKENELSLIGYTGRERGVISSQESLLEELTRLVEEAVKEQKIIYIESLDTGNIPQEGRTALEQWGVEGLVLLPLVANGRLIGTILLGRSQPWPLDAQNERFYRLLANQLAIAVEKARLHRQEVAQQQVDRELALSRQVQTGMLPQYIPQLEGWEFAVCYQPAREVGGDFYDYFRLPEASGAAQEWGLVVADVADKGMPAAIFMALSRSDPAETLLRANETILREASGALFLTAFYARLDTQTGKLRFTNAGHNRPLWVRSDGEITEITTRGVVLGVLEEISLSEDEIQLASGDSLVLYTDGIIEAVDQSEQLFGTARLAEAVKQAAGSSPQQMVDAIVGTVQQFTAGMDQSDDITVLVVRRLPT